MTVYAQNDICAKVIPASFGGCNQLHRRPVVNGAPAKLWALDCPQCEDHLRSDPQWSTTLSELPETYDEKLRREDFEKRGALDERKLMAMALAKLTGIDIPETIAGAISGIAPHIAGLMECASCGNGQPAGAKFCNECGQPMSQPVSKAAISAPERHAEPPAAAPSQHQGPKPARLRDANRQTLAALARASGLDDSGKRADLIGRLAAAGVTSAGLQRFLEGQPVAA
jgi:hypothetical protein